MNITNKSILSKPSFTLCVLFLTLSCSSPKPDIENNLQIEFEKFYEFAKDDLGEIKFSYDTLKTVDYNGFRINAVKVIGRGKPNWSISEKIMIIGQDINILTDSEFVQIDDNITECGVGGTTVLDIKEIRNYLAIDNKIKYESCCGQHEVIEISRKIFDKNLDSVLSYESFYENLQNGKCVKVEPIEKRETMLSFEESDAVLTTKVFLNNKFEKETIKKINLK